MNKSEVFSVIKDSMTDYANYLLSLVFPNRCIFCRELNSPFEDICPECDENLPRIDGEICPYCGTLTEDCNCRKRTGNYYDGIVAPLYYEDKVKTAIHDYKFNGCKNNVKLLSLMMSETCRERYGDIKFDYVSCVPSEKRRNRNGYRHSELLAKLVAKRLEIPFYPDILLKIYPTKHQRDCPEIVRKGNLCGASDVNQKYDVENKNILLVDDIKTTGSTLSECGKMLFLYGASGVYCLTAAIGKGKKKDKDIQL